MLIEVKPTDRLHYLVWKSRHDYEDNPWRASGAINGIPIAFGERFPSWADAYNYVMQEVTP